MFDLRLDLRTGDFVISPDGDIAGVDGLAVHMLRMHIRLMIQKSAWVLDFTEGELGSRLPGLLRQGMDVALAEADLLIREALEPMTDVEVLDVQVQHHPQDTHSIQASITLQPLVTFLTPNTSAQVFDLTFVG
jgi:phage gp46-like protein